MNKTLMVKLMTGLLAAVVGQVAAASPATAAATATATAAGLLNQRLVVVGASHKFYLEAYLNQMHDVQLVETDTVLRH